MTRRTSFSTRFTRIALAVFIAVGSLTLVPSIANAAGVFTAGLSQTTGTAPFDSSDNAGYDSSPTNDIVRTNDFVTYHVSIGAEEGQATAPTITFTLPQGEQMAALPAFCAAGSSLTPPTMPAPTISGSGTPYTSLPIQTVTCVVADLPSGTAKTYDFVSRVRPEVPNGTVLGPVSATVTSSDSATVTTDPVSHTVSATSKFDLSINGATATENSAFVKQATVQRCSLSTIPRNPDGSNQWCFVGGYPVTVSIPEGGKGGVPMVDGNFAFQINVDPTTIWGAAAVAADPNLSGGYLGVHQDSPYESPNSYLNQGTAANSVRNSGTITTTQPGGPGTPITVNVTGADTTGYTVPTDATAPAGYKVWPERGYIWTQRIFVEVPVTALMADDQLAGVDINPAMGTIQAPVTVTANESSMTYKSIDGKTNAYADPDGTKNNYRTALATVRDYLPVQNFWTSPVNYPTATAPEVFSPGYPAWWGPSGPTGKDTGDGVAVQDQIVLSTLQLSGDAMSGTTTLICQSFDNTKTQIAPGNYPGNGPAQQTISSSQFAPFTDTDTGGATWISGSMINFGAPTVLSDNDPTTQYAMNDRFGEFSVQYGSGPAGDNNCTGAITWSDTPSASTNHVRVFIQNKPGSNALSQRTSISIAMKVIGGAPGDYIPTWSTYTQASGVQTFATMSDPARNWVTSGYDPAANNDDTPNQEGRSGDRLTFVSDMARIGKEVFNPATGQYMSTDAWVPYNRTWISTASTLPTYAPGQTVQYRLTPTVTAAVPNGGATDVLIEDCMPNALVWDSASTPATYFGTGHLPYTPTLTCGADEYYVAWSLPGVTDTTAIPPIIVNAHVLATASTSVVLNTAQISIPGDKSSVDQRTAKARLQIQAPNGVSLSKASLTKFINVDPNGWVSSQQVHWQIVAQSVDSSVQLSDVDLIDVLPKSGLNGSSFTGSGDFVSATVDNPNARLLYTASAAPTDATFDDFSDATNATYNGATGSTVWCDAPSGGSVVLGAGTAADCPQAASDVTALRVQRLGQFGTSERIVIDIYTDATGNKGTGTPYQRGDVMVNTTQMHATGLDVPLGATDQTYFRDVPAPFNTGSISGAVWDDTNTDGVWDWTDTNGNGVWDSGEPRTEPVIPGVTVTLTGTDPTTGQPISMTTTTDANGNYSFSGLLSDVEYTLTFTPPAGMEPTITGHDSVGSTYTFTLTSPSDQFQDGINSGFISPASMQLTKTVTVNGQSASSAKAGDTLTYTVTATNTSDRPYTTTFPATFVDDLSAVLDDGTLASGPTASLGTASLKDGKIVWSGPLDPGQSVTVTYTVTATGKGDQAATNVAFGTTDPVDPTTGVPTNPTTGQPSTPPADCAAPTCATTTTQINATQLSVEKTATSGGQPVTEVVAGSTVDYTVTLTNTDTIDYTTAHPATFIDDLSGVLDDGTVTGVSASSGTATLNGSRVVWSGPLAAGQSVTITYQLTVTGSGDHTATNVAFVTTDPVDPATGVPTNPTTGQPSTPPADCAAPTCATTTTTVVPQQLSIEKTATSGGQPATEVVAGSTVDYTITLTNTDTVDYTESYPATFVDNLAGVMDDGAVTGVTASSGTATLVGTRVVWSGPLAAGQSVTVTYQLAVTADGDHSAKNVAFVTTDPINPDTGVPTNPTTGGPSTPPADCAAPTCATTTTTVVPQQLSIEKTATSGGKVMAQVTDGAVVDYTITLTNTDSIDYTAGYPATFVDDLSGVLDDGTIAGVTASSGTATLNGSHLVWSGLLAAGESVTVTYHLTVNASGDHTATNIAFVTTDPVDPTTGVPTNPTTGQPSTPPANCATPTCATTTTTIGTTPVVAPPGGTQPPGTEPPGTETPGGTAGGTQSPGTPGKPQPAGNTPAKAPVKAPVKPKHAPGKPPLAYTGVDVADNAWLAAILIGAGAAFLLTGRRRTR